MVFIYFFFKEISVYKGLLALSKINQSPYISLWLRVESPKNFQLKSDTLLFGCFYKSYLIDMLTYKNFCYV